MLNPIKIAVDAMGGENSPYKVIKGIENVDKITRGDGQNGSVSNPDKILNITIKK